MCVDTKQEFDRWTTSIRIAKVRDSTSTREKMHLFSQFGQQLKINHFLMDKAMSIYRSSGKNIRSQSVEREERVIIVVQGRFAAVCAARSATPNEQKPSEVCSSPPPPPTPCSSIRDRQVLNRTPVSTNGNPSPNNNHYYTVPGNPPSQGSFSSSSAATVNRSTNSQSSPPTREDEDQNDENSPIKSASYMDELRQRLERVLNDPSSPAPSSNSPLPPERHSCLPISKSFRLPTHTVPTQVQSSASHRPSILSRVPLKSSGSPSSQLSHFTPPLSKISNLRGPALIIPPKFKPTPVSSSCLSSTENLRSNHLPVSSPITMGSTPLPRKQLQPFLVPDRTLSYRTTNPSSSPYGYQCHFSSSHPHQQQMSKSFIMPTKREGRSSRFLFSIFLSRSVVDHRSASSLSVASKSDSLHLDDTELSPPSSTFLEGLADSSTHQLSKATNPVKSKFIAAINGSRSKLTPPPTAAPLRKPAAPLRTSGRPQPPLPVKTGLRAPSLKLSTSISQTGSLNKSLVVSTSNNSLNNSKLSAPSTTTMKSVPPVPPRKSSIPRPAIGSPPSLLVFKPQPPQRDSSSNLLLLHSKAHVSHL